MDRAAREEYASFAVATAVLLVILIACFMCIQLYRLRKPAPAPPGGCALPARGSEPFLGRFYYAPACDTGWASTRASCRGVTAGAMPSIEVGGERGWGLCPGALGVPP